MSGLDIKFFLKLFYFRLFFSPLRDCGKGVVQERLETTLFRVRQQVIQLLPTEFRNSVRRRLGNFFKPGEFFFYLFT